MASDKRIRLFWVSSMLIIGIVLLFFVLRPFLAEIFLAIVLAVIAFPLYKKIRGWIPSDGWASFVSTIIILLLIIAPISFIGTLLVKEAVSFTTSFSTTEQSIVEIISKTDNFIAEKVSVYSPGTISVDSTARYVNGAVKWLANNLQGIFSNIFEWLVSTVIMLLALYYLFKDGSKFYEGVLYVSPLDDEVDKKIGHEIASIMRAVMTGRIVVGIAQGLAAYLGFLFFGIDQAILLAALVTIIAVMPLIGPLVVIIPVALYQLAIGAVLPAVGLILWGIFVVGLVDNVIGPLMIHSKTNLHPFVVLIAILGGFQIFGLVGFVAGPVLVGIVYALSRTLPLVYAEQTKKTRTRRKKKTA